MLAKFPLLGLVSTYLYVFRVNLVVRKVLELGLKAEQKHRPSRVVLAELHLRDELQLTVLHFTFLVHNTTYELFTSSLTC